MLRLFISFLVSLVLISCDNTDKTDPAATKDEYQKTKESLQQKEKKNPAMFLTVTGSDKHNLIGQMVVKGKITNKAVATTYKDIEVKLTYYSKTGALLENDKETVYETITPGKTINFKTKYFAPKGSDSVALEIITAKVSGE
jgi:hypothetical protein